MRILVTGGAGLVGQALKRVLPPSPDVTYVGSNEFNLISEYETERLFMREKPEAVVHLAARVGGIQDNINNPCDFYEKNVQMNTNLVKMARLYECERLIAVLSTCAYPDVASKYPMTEDQLHESPPAATNFGYGLAKRAMAAHIDVCNKQYGTKFQYLIPSNIYGVGEKYDENKTHFLGAFIHRMKDCPPKGMMKIWGNGIPRRQFLFADDLARAIKLCLYLDIYESFNVAPPENLTIGGLARIAMDACGLSEANLECDTSKPSGQINKEVSSEKMMKLLPDFQFTPLAEGIKQVFYSITNK